MNAVSVADRVAALAAWPKAGPPLVMVTAYDYVSARTVDDAGVDLVLVGDSAATTVLGYSTTREITRDELLMLTRAARRGVQRALLVGDLPFGSYEASDAAAVASARLFIDAGCDLIKLEGAGAMLPRVQAIVAAGIPVMGHVGLLPQSAVTPDDLRAQGRTATEALRTLRDARELVDAGCCALVIEAVPAAVAAAVADRVTVPVIGIGAGAGVDGQVLVLHDVLGLGDGHVPRFVRAYAALRALSLEAVRHFASDVRDRTFPSAAEEYGMPAAQRAHFEETLRTLDGAMPR